MAPIILDSTSFHRGYLLENQVKQISSNRGNLYIPSLTTQAQRPGPRNAPIATGARWLDSLQRMVRLMSHLKTWMTDKQSVPDSPPKMDSHELELDCRTPQPLPSSLRSARTSKNARLRQLMEDNRKKSLWRRLRDQRTNKPRPSSRAVRRSHRPHKLSHV